MKINLTCAQARRATLFILAAILNAQVATFAQTTDFTYQGQLVDKATGVPVTGNYDMRFYLRSAATGSNPGDPLYVCDGTAHPYVKVDKGLFTVTLNFGAGPFSGASLWLEIQTKNHDLVGATYDPLPDRTEVTSVPYAITAANLTSGGLAAGTYGNAVTFNNPANSFTGDGSGLSGLNVANISGVFADAHLSANVALLDHNQTFTGNNSFGNVNINGALSVTPSTSLFSGVGVDDLWLFARPPSDATNSYFLRARTGHRGIHGGDPLFETDFVLRGDGLVGIGTENPTRKLEVQGTGDVEIGLKSTDAGGRLWTIQSSGNGVGDLGKFQIIDRTLEASRLTLDLSGNVGIGSVSPRSKMWIVNGGPELIGTALSSTFVASSGSLPIDVGADAALANFGVAAEGNNVSLGLRARRISTGTGWTTAAIGLTFDVDNTVQAGAGIWLASNGNVGCGTANPTNKLDVAGRASVHTLTICGGSDLAEPFEISDREIPKGSLVVIDDENAGKLKLAAQEYDTRVAGIVSGANGVNPGISLYQEGVMGSGQNVALSGRVYALADASSAPIKPGDLLTSSGTPGHVMKVADHTRAQGAIVGKAMSSLKEGKGVVLVLVTLQ